MRNSKVYTKINGQTAQTVKKNDGQAVEDASYKCVTPVPEFLLQQYEYLRRYSLIPS